MLPASAADVADFLEARRAVGASPATVRTTRAAGAKGAPGVRAHRSHADGLMRDVRRRKVGTEAGARSPASAGRTRKRRPPSPRTVCAGLQGLRDAAIIRVMSDTLARISEVAALRHADVEADATGGGTVLIRASKSDQQGEGSTRYVGPATLSPIRWAPTASAP